MTSIILRTATRLLLPLLLLFSLFLLLRGHNEPGGGFAGGLVAASAFALYSISHTSLAARRALWIDPRLLISIGLLLALLSGIPAVLVGLPFLTGLWGTIRLPGRVEFDFGTPMLFEFGVYFLVTGIALLIIFSLEEA
ncbi:MAG: Na+/H+ antiporter subunit B [Chloroflexi bacterium]|nr:MAG: Na+/H+ antiporter subunit B [Chloroflexota bacterium]